MTGVLAKFGAVRFEPHAHQTAMRIESKLRCHTSELTSVTDFNRKANNSAMHVKHVDPRTWRYLLRVHFMHFWVVLHDNSDPICREYCYHRNILQNSRRRVTQKFDHL